MGISYKHAYKYYLSCEKFQLIGGKPVGCLQGTSNKFILGMKRNKSHLVAECMVRTQELSISIPVPSLFNSKR